MLGKLGGVSIREELQSRAHTSGVGRGRGTGSRLGGGLSQNRLKGPAAHGLPGRLPGPWFHPVLKAQSWHREAVAQGVLTHRHLAVGDKWLSGWGDLDAGS